jgi:hypothetical protein
MDIRDHGAWQIYKPHTLPKDAPPHTMFAQRGGDGVDWYDYVNCGENFAEDSVVMTLVDGAVAAATADPTMLFPGGATVLEVRHMLLNDPQKVFGNKLYDAAKKDFRDPPPPPAPPPPIDELLKRLEALESKGA